mgnify:CR=1 FL=1
MPGTQNDQLQRAVADAVQLVNDHSGQACVRLLFNSGDDGPIDFVANAASLQGDHFTFRSGFETFDGRLAELADIRTDLIRH